VKALSALIDDIFAPVTEKLNLTQEQRLQIIAIIIETEVSADPWLQSLATIDQQLSELPLAEVLDENRMLAICEQQATIMSEVIQMRLRAKARIYRLLTTEQRAIVAQQFRIKRRPNGNWGPTGIY
jgi:Spy/CpxP family protein refolding chaperone